MMSRFRIGAWRLALAALLSAGAAALLPQAARAETRITGNADAVRVEAREASLEEVLAALAAKFSMQYRAKVPLGRRIHRTFAGSLSRVISRLLDGYDHVVKRGPDGMEVLILGVSPKPSSPGGSPFPRISLRGAELAPFVTGALSCCSRSRPARISIHSHCSVSELASS